MSGPKTSRYNLTPEERRRREELRRRQLRRQAANNSLNGMRGELEGFITRLEGGRGALCELILVSEGKNDRLDRLDRLSSDCAALRRHCSVEKGLSLEALEEKASACEKRFATLKASALLLEGELFAAKTELADRKQAARLSEVTLSFADIEAEETVDTEGYREILSQLLADEKVSFRQKERARELLSFLAGANAKQLESFSALHLKPLLADCESDRREYDRLSAEYLPLRREYEGLCALCGDQPISTECGEEGVAILKEAVRQKSLEVARDDEEGYIAEALDEVMEELGYRIKGERISRNGQGRRFRHSLYRYGEGVVIDVTESSDGKITMEIGAADNCDRLPTAEEVEALRDSMEDFCVSFAEIEEKLAERGIVPSRISHMPVSDACAQIINVKEYDARAEDFGSITAEEGSASQEELLQIRRRIRKARSLRIE